MTAFAVVGAGVSGLYTAYSLVKHGIPGHHITIVAQYHPGDSSVNYTSPSAGGNFSTISPDDTDTVMFDRYTYQHLEELQKDLGGPGCGLNQFPIIESYDYMPPQQKLVLLMQYAQDFEFIPRDEFVDQEVVLAVRYKTWNFNCPLFLAKMADFLKENGVQFEKQKLNHIEEAFSDDTTCVFNCSGLGSATLGGVNDRLMYPTRGQVVIIRAPHINQNMFRWGKNSATYIIPRPDSNLVVLGGFLDRNNYSGDTTKEETEDILKRATELHPALLDLATGKGIEIVRESAGLRPSRKGGVRIERQKLPGGKLVIHNYGAGGYGYQSGLGMAHRAVSLVMGSKM
jgi:glycine/D-amino acid oxidase-like deaminating enzyme